MALGVDVGGDTDNGGGESEDGGELHFDRDTIMIFVSHVIPGVVVIARRKVLRDLDETW